MRTVSGRCLAEPTLGPEHTRRMPMMRPPPNRQDFGAGAEAAGAAGAGAATNGPGSAHAGVSVGGLASLPAAFIVAWYLAAALSMDLHS